MFDLGVLFGAAVRAFDMNALDHLASEHIVVRGSRAYVVRGVPQGTSVAATRRCVVKDVQHRTRAYVPKNLRHTLNFSFSLFLFSLNPIKVSALISLTLNIIPPIYAVINIMSPIFYILLSILF